MKIGKLTIVLSAVLAIALVVGIFYRTRRFVFNRIKFYAIERIESSTKLGIKIESANYTPLKGLCLAGVSFYRDTSCGQKISSASHIFVKFSPLKFLAKRAFSPTIAISGLSAGGVSVNGTFGMEMKKNVINNIWFHSLSVKSSLLNMENINGTVDMSPESIEAKVSSPKINLISIVKKENEIYKISKFEGSTFDSSFEFVGELSGVGEDGNAPTFSLYGDANVHAKDIVHFMPSDLGEKLKRLGPKGALANSIYFKITGEAPPSWELGIKTNADSLELGRIKLSNLRIDTRIKDGLVNMPILNAHLYDGALTSSATLDLQDEHLPYQMNCKLSDMDVRTVLENIGLKLDDIKGNLSCEFRVEGQAKHIETANGPGKIVVKDANLGPMPLLSPLLGHIYGYFQNVFPELKKVSITGGSADFYIRDRKLATENLVLSGDVVNIHAKGYIDFDKNLDFEVENKIVPQEPAQEGDWQANLQNIIVQFGKMISKARLTGTLEKPKWKFEYLSGIQDVFKGGFESGLKDILKDILE